eukprot:scaffold76568_cov38-Prasinocladus_malaysianus.AAC.1
MPAAIASVALDGIRVAGIDREGGCCGPPMQCLTVSTATCFTRCVIPAAHYKEHIPPLIRTDSP